MTDTPTLTVYVHEPDDKCEHGERFSHMLAQKGMAQMMWTCPGGREIVLRRERAKVADGSAAPWDEIETENVWVEVTK